MLVVGTQQAVATLAKNCSRELLVVERLVALRTFRRKWNRKDLSPNSVGIGHRSSQVTLRNYAKL